MSLTEMIQLTALTDEGVRLMWLLTKAAWGSLGPG